MHEPVGRVQFVVFEKFTSADLSQIARDKSCDYLYLLNRNAQQDVLVAVYRDNMSVICLLTISLSRRVCTVIGGLSWVPCEGTPPAHKTRVKFSLFQMFIITVFPQISTQAIIKNFLPRSGVSIQRRTLFLSTMFWLNLQMQMQACGDRNN